MLCAIGVDGARWELVERKIDLDRVVTQGFAWHRFPRSCVLAFGEVNPRLAPPARRAVEFAIFLAALGVYLDRPSLVPDAQNVLHEIAQSCDLVLITKGEPWIQRRRIRQSGLHRHFERCVVVRQKTAQTFAATAIGRRLCISVGNSLASDIAPALAAGFIGVRVDGYMWEHERRDAELDYAGVVTVTNLREVVAAIHRILADDPANFRV
jgi:FMN phosphatase YigB (HAD superfamily)